MLLSCLIVYMLRVLWCCCVNGSVCRVCVVVVVCASVFDVVVSVVVVMGGCGVTCCGVCVVSCVNGSVCRV